MKMVGHWGRKMADDQLLFIALGPSLNKTIIYKLTVLSMCNVFSFARTFGENGRTLGSENGR